MPRKEEMIKKPTFNWAVFNVKTELRLTLYTSRRRAYLARRYILNDQPDLRGKIAVKHRNFESK